MTATRYIERIDEMGGMVEAIERGFPQKEIADASYALPAAGGRDEKTIVGVNKYEMDSTTTPGDPGRSAEVERRQLESLGRLKRERDGGGAETIEAFKAGVPRASENLLPLMLDAVRAYATVGEVCSALIPVFGTYARRPCFD